LAIAGQDIGCRCGDLRATPTSQPTRPVHGRSRGGPATAGRPFHRTRPSPPLKRDKLICPSSGDSVRYRRARTPFGAKNRVRVKSNFVSRFKLIRIVSWPRANILLSENQKMCILPTVPLPQEGRFAVVTDVGSGMRWTRQCRKTSDTGADGEGVWSWRPDAGAKFLRSKLLRNDGGKRARSPGRARYKP
jgi:hypothetical protein